MVPQAVVQNIPAETEMNCVYIVDGSSHPQQVELQPSNKSGIFLYNVSLSSYHEADTDPLKHEPELQGLCSRTTSQHMLNFGWAEGTGDHQYQIPEIGCVAFQLQGQFCQQPRLEAWTK